ncbi:hypothetical protein BY996DRAFT_6934072 [Phakopsora pachyrhizi]|nr:hypothetical protein BY996DRAFT_6934072 [Phakopsora pachyrhizi]
MIGYNGIKILVNKTLSKFIEQVDGGDLILNKGDKEKPKSKHSRNKEGRFLSNEGLLQPVSNQGPTSCRSSSRST